MLQAGAMLLLDYAEGILARVFSDFLGVDSAYRDDIIIWL
jgi:hypothetical protein